MSFGFGHRFGSKSIADRSNDRTLAESADRCEEDRTLRAVLVGMLREG
jgi:hypothetical protein